LPEKLATCYMQLATPKGAFRMKTIGWFATCLLIVFALAACFEFTFP